MKRIFAFLLLLLCLSPIFASLTKSDVLDVKDRLETIFLSVAASYINVPKINLENVEYINGEGVLPRKVCFYSSDVSTYYNSLSNPKVDGFLGFLSKFTSSSSPIMKKALEELSALGLKKGDFIVDGDVEISGGDNITMASLLSRSGLNNLSILVDGRIKLSGNKIEKGKDIKLKLNIKTNANNKIEIDINECNIDQNTIYITPIIVSFD